MNKHDIQHQLDDLRASGRLGLHVCEDTGIDNTYVFPAETIKLLTDYTPDTLLEGLSNYSSKWDSENTIPLFSTTLVPSGAKIIPYHMHAGGDAPFALPVYLLDLSQNDPDTAPRIVGVHKDSMLSGIAFQKDTNVFVQALADQPFNIHSSETEPLKVIRPKHHISHDEALQALNIQGISGFDLTQAMCQAAASDGGLSRGNTLLDALNTFYDDKTDYTSLPIPLNPHDVRFDGFHLNEVLTTLQMDHVKAIAIPMLTTTHASGKTVEAINTLMGCVQALEHHAKGHALPLVTYDLNQPIGEEITVLATTREEIETLAQKAAHKINDLANNKALTCTSNAIFIEHYEQAKEILAHYDITIPTITWETEMTSIPELPTELTTTRELTRPHKQGHAAEIAQQPREGLTRGKSTQE